MSLLRRSTTTRDGQAERVADRPAKLGDRLRDRVSGWTGIATARYEYLNGCVRWSVGAADDNGAPKDYVFDDEQVEVLEPDVEPAPARRHGGARGTTPPARR